MPTSQPAQPGLRAWDAPLLTLLCTARPRKFTLDRADSPEQRQMGRADVGTDPALDARLHPAALRQIQVHPLRRLQHARRLDLRRACLRTPGAADARVRIDRPPRR